jgi:fluoride ion exporter CrcB/FEX
MKVREAPPESVRITAARDVRIANGAGAAAVLAAGIGSFVLGALAVLADKSAAVKSRMIFSKATGPLSGVTTLAIVAWLLAWLVLHWRWRGRDVALPPVLGAALALLALALLLTFPPIADWL